MRTDFNTISDSSKLWVYGSETKLSDKEQSFITDKIGEYLNNWEYHKNPLTAAVTILENHFIVVALDDADYGVGGCSIDSLQRIIQELEKELNISLLNRLNIFCKVENEIQCISTFKLGSVATENTLFYDLTIQRKSDLENYIKPIKKGWCSRYL